MSHTARVLFYAKRALLQHSNHGQFQRAVCVMANPFPQSIHSASAAHGRLRDLVFCDRNRQGVLKAFVWFSSLASLLLFSHHPVFSVTRRQWQPTPVFLPGESQRRGSLVGCRLWGRQSQTRLRRLGNSSSSRRRKWQPTPMFLPGESEGWGSLVGYSPWGCTELDVTEGTWQQQQSFQT